MLKKDLSELLNNAKSIYFSFVRAVSENYIISLALLLGYLLIFIIDPSVRFWFSRIHNNVFDFLFNIGHWFGKPFLMIYSILILYFSGLILKKEKIRKIGWMLFQSFLFSGIIVTIIKTLLGRWRPYTEHGNLSFVFLTLRTNDHLSLPSGDVAVAFAFSAIAAGIFKNKLWKIFWFGLAILTAIGRIYHDQHWLTNVVLASIISIFVGTVVNKSRMNSELT